MRRWTLALLSLAALAACAPQAPVRTALQGNLADLKRDLQSAQKSGKLDRDLALSLAQAVGERELTSAEGANGALRVRGLRGCARPLRSSIERRAQAEDDVAAELMLILVEGHAVDRVALLNRHARATSGAWRAVAARAALRPVDTDLRKAFFFDPDERVRRAALGSAREVHYASELEALLEAARLDPDPQSQSLAARAAGAIGGERAVLALKDLWARADDPRRIAIVDGWTERASFVAGGARELAIVSESGGGLAAISASYALLRAGGPESMAANARLQQKILDGTDDEKRLAISITPLNAETEAAISKAAHEAGAELRVVALTRLSGTPAKHDDALRSLRELANAKPGSDAELRARDAAVSALADAGDTSVAATLVKNLSDQAPQIRWRAARGLASLGDYAHAAGALADDDANLRLDLACTILAHEAAASR